MPTTHLQHHLHPIIVVRHGHRADWVQTALQPHAQNDTTMMSTPIQSPTASINFPERKTPSYTERQSLRVNDPYLSNHGQEQAKQLGKHVARTLPQGVRFLLVSPYIRTIETAMGIVMAYSKDKRPKICLEGGLREWYYDIGHRPQIPVAVGRLHEYFPIEEVGFDVKELIDHEYKSFVPIPEENTDVHLLNETVVELKKRTWSLATHLKSLAHAGPVLCVSHAATKIATVRALVDDSAGQREVRCGVCSMTTLKLPMEFKTAMKSADKEDSSSRSMDDGTGLDMEIAIQYETEFLEQGEERSWNFSKWE